MKWKRPSGEYPKIYAKFEGKVIKNGEKRTYWIQDLTEEYYQKAVEAYVSDFLKDEPLCNFTKILEDPVAVDDFRKLWIDLFKQKMSLICLAEGADGKPQVAGFNCLFVVSRDDKEEKVNSPRSQKVMDIMHHLQTNKDPFEILKVDHYLYAMGLSVLKEFRGEGLGQKIINAREPLCKQFGVKATLTAFTSFISQKQAIRDGFVELTSLAYEDFPEHLQVPGITEHTKYCKLMYKLY